MDKQVFANHDFNVVKHGLSNNYSIENHPYKETHMGPIDRKTEYGSDTFFIKCSDKINGKNKKIKIQIF